MREISEAKVAMMTRPSDSAKMRSKVGSSVRSDGVIPGVSTWTQSEISTSGPRRPKSVSLAKSVGRPSTGVWSNL